MSFMQRQTRFAADPAARAVAQLGMDTAHPGVLAGMRVDRGDSVGQPPHIAVTALAGRLRHLKPEVDTFRIRQATATGNPSAASRGPAGTLFWEDILPGRNRRWPVWRISTSISRTRFSRRSRTSSARLVFGQALLVAFLDVGLAHPAAKAGLADPDVLGDLGDRLPQPANSTARRQNSSG